MAVTIERRIAGRAREMVKSRQEPNDPKHPKESEYLAMCQSFPMLLRSAGLAQAVAFLYAKDEPLYGHLEKQFREAGLLGDKGLTEKITSLTLADYRWYSEIAMQAAMWHKRMAQALLRAKGKP